MEDYTILCCCGFLVVMAAMAIGAIQIYQLEQNKSAAKRLAEKMNYTLLNEATKVKDQWYGGSYRGRRVAIRPNAYLERVISGGGRDFTTKHYMQIVVQLRPNEPIGYRTNCTRSKSRTTNSFDEAFTVDGTKEPAQETKDVMFRFAQKYIETKKDRGYVLYAAERALMNEGFVEKHLHLMQTMPDASGIVMMENKNMKMSPEEFHALLDDMIKVADSIESNG